MASPNPGPSTQVGGDEIRHKVRAAVDALPELEREVVVLRVFEGLTFPEIAQVTGAKLSTAKSRMVYALRKLRPVLEGMR